MADYASGFKLLQIFYRRLYIWGVFTLEINDTLIKQSIRGVTYLK